MRKSNEQSLGDVIKEWLKANRMDGKLLENKLIHSWDQVVGPMIAKHTTDISIRNKVLYVRFDSAALKNELSFAKSKLIDNLNNEVKAKVIEDIRFL